MAYAVVVHALVNCVAVEKAAAEHTVVRSTAAEHTFVEYTAVECAVVEHVRLARICCLGDCVGPCVV